MSMFGAHGFSEACAGAAMPAIALWQCSRSHSRTLTAEAELAEERDVRRLAEELLWDERQARQADHDARLDAETALMDERDSRLLAEALLVEERDALAAERDARLQAEAALAAEREDRAQADEVVRRELSAMLRAMCDARSSRRSRA
jgi:hypothetical protein